MNNTHKTMRSILINFTLLRTTANKKIKGQIISITEIEVLFIRKARIIVRIT